MIIIDTVGPLQKTANGNQYAVTMICDLSKFLVVAPTEDKSAKSVARAIFEQFILKYGPMNEIRTDRGTEYRNEILHELCTLMQIKHNFSTSYHHESVGSVERSHRTMNEYIRSFVTDLTDWDTYIHYFCLCYNMTNHSSL